MKAVAMCFLVLFLGITIANAQEQQPKSETEPEAIFIPPWFHPHPHPYEHYRFPFPHPHLHLHPHLHPHFHLPGFPFPYAAQPPTSPSTTPSTPSTDSNGIGDFDALLKFPYHPHHMATKEQRECFMAVHDKKMGACLRDLHHYIMTRNIKLGAHCCGALEKIEDACQPLVKHPLPILEGIITHHCSAAAPSPSS